MEQSYYNLKKAIDGTNMGSSKNLSLLPRGAIEAVIQKAWESFEHKTKGRTSREWQNARGLVLEVARVDREYAYELAGKLYMPYPFQNAHLLNWEEIQEIFDELPEHASD